jgi:hypothetical protein
MSKGKFHYATSIFLVKCGPALKSANKYTHSGKNLIYYEKFY